MSHSYLFRTLLVMVLSSFIFFSCQENDDLYGVTRDDYIPTGGSEDAKADRYFNSKEASCVDAKYVFAEEKSTGWVEVGFVLESPEGSIVETPFSSNSVARLDFVHPSPQPQGGDMVLSFANKTGYSKRSILRPCNEEENYFYIADYDAGGGKLMNVLAFSVSSRDLLKINEAAHMHGPYEPGHTVVGLRVRRGTTGPGSELQKVGNVPYTATLLRQNFCNNGDQRWYLNPSIQITKSCVGNSSKLNGRTLSHFTIFEPTTTGTWYDEGPAIELFTRGESSRVAARITEYPLPDRYNRQCSVKVYKRGRLLHSFNGYVSGNFSTSETNVRIDL